MKDRNGWTIEPGDLVRLSGNGLHERLDGSVARVVGGYDLGGALAATMRRLGHHGPFVELKQGVRLLILPESHIEQTAPRSLKPAGPTLDEIIEELNQ